MSDIEAACVNLEADWPYGNMPESLRTVIAAARASEAWRARAKRLESELRSISLGAQNSMTSKEGLGREARKALGEAEG